MLLEAAWTHLGVKTNLKPLKSVHLRDQKAPIKSDICSGRALWIAGRRFRCMGGPQRNHPHVGGER